MMCENFSEIWVKFGEEVAINTCTTHIHTHAHIHTHEQAHTHAHTHTSHVYTQVPCDAYKYAGPIVMYTKTHTP